MRLVFDLEGDGLREDITKVWCIVTIDIDTEEMCFYTPQEIERGLKHLGEAEELIGHNIISYDLQVLNDLYGFTYNGKVFDTLVTSRLLNPDRTGGHSLEAWGRQFDMKKPEHEDWSRFTEEMLHRCKEDTKINLRIYRKQQEEIKSG